MSIWEEVEAEYACSHERREVRYSVASNGARQWREQCVKCGHLTEFLKYNHPRVMAVAEPVAVDEELREAYQQTIRLEAQRRITEQADLDMQQRAREQEERDTAWWVAYNEYLKTDDWQARRQMVLQRDGFMCKACGVARATTAHHLTYDHGVDAPLFDLIAVCEACHQRITVLDRAVQARRRTGRVA